MFGDSLKTTVYNERYKSKENYWEFKPSSMILRALEMLPNDSKNLKVLEIGCGEGGSALYLAEKGYGVTAFDLSPVAIEKTQAKSRTLNLNVTAFVADVNDYKPTESYDMIFSSGTLQYLHPDNRARFIRDIQEATNSGGINILHTFVEKPFVKKAPDAEKNEFLWTSGEILNLYKSWRTLDFLEEIKPCQSSGISHEHAHNRIWTTKPY